MEQREIKALTGSVVRVSIVADADSVLLVSVDMPPLEMLISRSKGELGLESGVANDGLLGSSIVYGMDKKLIAYFKYQIPPEEVAREVVSIVTVDGVFDSFDVMLEV